jgi:solute:Na+ symporter, SSS family
VMIIPLTVQWWSVWYPGAEPGGGSYVAQRMLAARSERDALAGTLFFNVAHYALRSWPWIIVALASMLVYPTVADIGTALPHVDPKLIGNDMAYPAMLRFLPAGLLGLMVAGLLAAYVSTISTHLNWGTSYLVHDVYRRFFRGDADERHYVLMARICTAVLMVVAALLTYVLETAKQSFDLLLAIGAGTGLLYLLRWFWWRITAWSEIAAMASSFVIAVGIAIAQKNGAGIPSSIALLFSVGATSVVWLLVAYFGPRTDRATLLSFYRLVRPGGPGWADIRREAGVPAAPDSLPQALLGWMLGLAFVYGSLFGVGSLLFGHTGPAIAWISLAAVSGIGLVRLLPRLWSGAGTT